MQSMISTRAAFGDALKELAQNNTNIVALDADLSGSTKSAELKKIDVKRHINCGIAEANMMGMAAGLALTGKTVFACSFAIFSAGRAWEQIRNTIAYSKIPVKIIGTHSGILAGEDGASHQMLEDVALMKSIPGMRVFSPADHEETVQLIRAIVDDPFPAYIRLGRANIPVIHDSSYTFQIGKGNILKEGTQATIFATGPLVANSLHAAMNLEKKGISIQVVNISTIAPLDADLIVKCAQKTGFVFTAEDHSVTGGLGSAVAEVLSKKHPTKIHCIGMESFGESGTSFDLYEKYEFDAVGIQETLEKHLPQ